MSREEELVRRAARGDREAFDELIQPRWERIFRIAWRVVGQKEEAEDVAQQACLRLWNSIGQYRPTRGDLDGWIYRVVVNLALDALRHRRARPERDAVSTSDQPIEPRYQGPDPELKMYARELELALQQLTAALPPRQKAVFVLSRVEGMTAPQIADVMQISASTVRNHLFQLRAQLSTQLREKFPHLLRGSGAASEPSEPSDPSDEVS